MEKFIYLFRNFYTVGPDRRKACSSEIQLSQQGESKGPGVGDQLYEQNIRTNAAQCVTPVCSMDRGCWWRGRRADGSPQVRDKNLTSAETGCAWSSSIVLPSTR